MLNALVSSGINFAGQMLGGWQQFKYQSELQRQAAQLNYDYGQKSLQNSPSSQRAGLEKAGYNPMLAVQNATSGANSGWTSAGQSSVPDYGNSFKDLIANAQSFQRLKNETHVSDTTSNKNEADAREANARAVKQELQNPFVTKREQAEIGKISAETSNIERNTKYFEALEHNLEVMQRLQEMGINLDYKAKIYGADTSYNASKYASDVAKFGHRMDALNNIRSLNSSEHTFGFGNFYRYTNRNSDYR